jgi:hypothetical protein
MISALRDQIIAIPINSRMNMKRSLALLLPALFTVLSAPTETSTEPQNTTLFPTISRDQSFLVLEEYKPLGQAFNKKDRN